MSSEQEKRKWQWRNAAKVALFYIGLFLVLLVVEHFGGIPERQSPAVVQECAVMGEESLSMSECHDIMLHGL
jgi:hypothetical protein